MSHWPVLLVVAALGLALGIFMSWRPFGGARREAQRLAAEVARLEGQSREQTRLLSKARTEQQSLANMARALPGLVR